MREQELKAVRLINAGRVQVHLANQGNLGTLAYAEGTVEGDTGTWHVTWDHGEPACNCPLGTHQPGKSHAHTIALYIAAVRQLQETPQ